MRKNLFDDFTPKTQPHKGTYKIFVSQKDIPDDKKLKKQFTLPEQQVIKNPYVNQQSLQYQGNQEPTFQQVPNQEEQSNSRQSQVSRKSALSNRSQISQRSENPLMNQVLPDVNSSDKSISNISIRTTRSKVNQYCDQLPNDQEELRRQIKQIQFDIDNLKNLIQNCQKQQNLTQEFSENQSKIQRINQLEIELINLQYQGKINSKKKNKIDDYFQSLYNNQKQKIDTIHQHYEKNRDKNKQTMLNEMEFKYINNEEEQIKYLQMLKNKLTQKEFKIPKFGLLSKQINNV